MTTPAMIHVADLPALLAERGIKIGYRLTIAAPKGSIDAEMKHLLTRHKPTLVEALARADAFGNPAIGYGDILTWDRQGFDWATGEQHRQPGDDGDDHEADAGPSEPERIDAMMKMIGAIRVGVDELARRFVGFDPPKIDPPAEPTTPGPRRKPPAEPTPPLDFGEPSTGKGAT